MRNETHGKKKIRKDREKGRGWGGKGLDKGEDPLGEG